MAKYGIRIRRHFAGIDCFIAATQVRAGSTVECHSRSLSASEIRTPYPSVPFVALRDLPPPPPLPGSPPGLFSRIWAPSGLFFVGVLCLHY